MVLNFFLHRIQVNIIILRSQAIKAVLGLKIFFPIIIMLLERYRPKSSREIVGNEHQVSEIRNWLGRWKKGRAVLVYGPTGSGKSLEARPNASDTDDAN